MELASKANGLTTSGTQTLIFNHLAFYKCMYEGLGVLPRAPRHSVPDLFTHTFFSRLALFRTF